MFILINMGRIMAPYSLSSVSQERLELRPSHTTSGTKLKNFYKISTSTFISTTFIKVKFKLILLQLEFGCLNIKHNQLLFGLLKSFLDQYRHLKMLDLKEQVHGPSHLSSLKFLYIVNIIIH